MFKGKNYSITYYCVECGRQWGKFMASKDDKNPEWLRYASDSEMGKLIYEAEHDL